MLVGAAVGVGVYTFGYTRGYSYLSSDPEACANCHIMDEHFSAWLKSSHARAATCNDCHMPYLRVGTEKVSDHWVRSPVLNVDNACQTCHRWTEEELKHRVYAIQDRTYQLRNIAIAAVLELTCGIADELAAGGVELERLGTARTYQRRAQFMTDFIAAENSTGFHADQEAPRVLGLAINYARLGQAALYAGALPEVPPPLLPPPPQTVVPPEQVRGQLLETTSTQIGSENTGG